MTKLIFKTQPDALGNYVVRGVEFFVDGEKYMANAAKEVIVSCGTVQTPQLLELSGILLRIIHSFNFFWLLDPPGIGQTSLLESFDIPCLVDLPGVGENLHVCVILYKGIGCYLLLLQDHIFEPIQYLLKPGTKTFGIPK